MSAHALPAFVSAGEALTDLIRTGTDQWTSRTGGAGLNVARAMARLGIHSAFAGAVSTDVFGNALTTSAFAAGLDPRFLQRREHAPLLAVVHETDPPAYFFIGSDSADLQFRPEDLPPGWESAAAWVHFGGISLTREPLAGRLVELAARLKDDGVRISYDPNFRNLMGPSYDRVMASMARLADVIKVSDEDLRGLFRTDDERDALSRLRALNPDAAILFTRGADGALYYDGGRGWYAPAPAISVVDTIGAGDASIAALLYSRMLYPDAHAATHLRAAVAAGAAACTRAGAVPPTRDEVAAFSADVMITALED
jgi:fructokinase